MDYLKRVWYYLVTTHLAWCAVVFLVLLFTTFNFWLAVGVPALYLIGKAIYNNVIVTKV